MIIANMTSKVSNLVTLVWELLTFFMDSNPAGFEVVEVEFMDFILVGFEISVYVCVWVWVCMCVCVCVCMCVRALLTFFLSFFGGAYSLNHRTKWALIFTSYIFSFLALDASIHG